MNKYAYCGPVMAFGQLIADRWEGETWAVSEAKARTNLSYQFKKKTNRIAGVKVTLPGKIIMLIEGGNDE